MSKTSTNSKRRKRAAQATEPDDALLAAWRKTLRENSDRPAIFNVQGKVTRTFAQIEERSAEFGHELIPLRSGQVIAIQIGNHPDWPSLFLACLRKRLVVLPLEQMMSDEQRRAAFETCRVVAAAVATRSSRPKSRGPEEVVFRLPPRDLSIRKAFGTRDDGKIEWSSRQPSLLKLTSGTTAAPRAIRFRSEQLLADCENICDTMGITSRDVNFGVIPISHSYGFSNLLTPLLVRAVPLALSSDRIPRAILEGMAATSTTVFPGMPVFYQSLCDLKDASSLPKLRLCISAGAPLSGRLPQLFHEKFSRAIHSFYGSSECGGICYARTPRAMEGFVGQPMRGVEIKPLESDHTASTIRVRSAAVGDGYFPEPDETRLGRGMFIPDDLLEKRRQGYRIVGRVSDLINVAGKKVSPAQVEAEILRCESVREVIVFARESARRNEEVMACVVPRGSVTEAELLAYCRARLSAWQMPRRIFFLEQLPVNQRGKISRRELARMYAGAELR